ncbi:hypothetical protein TcasGA2_TC005818 [Tribolium castaneum]|uniref:Uncharacterized protein n=1 Tax=Tribolium castaneum TaxID=7070 RepID=D6WW41_TRICA|nr:hypothetical protein TcasGA2_TC005818 [Tribolium castaneum]
MLNHIGEDSTKKGAGTMNITVDQTIGASTISPTILIFYSQIGYDVTSVTYPEVRCAAQAARAEQSTASSGTGQIGSARGGLFKLL